jgi:hypothetical protein
VRDLAGEIDAPVGANSDPAGKASGAFQRVDMAPRIDDQTADIALGEEAVLSSE